MGKKGTLNTDIFLLCSCLHAGAEAAGLGPQEGHLEDFFKLLFFVGNRVELEALLKSTSFWAIKL